VAHVALGLPQQQSRAGSPRRVMMQRPYSSSGPNTTSLCSTSKRCCFSSGGVLACVMWIVLRGPRSHPSRRQFQPPLRQL
jgi:hypothetical protein